MHILTKGEALQFVRERADMLDAAANPPNPFARSAWVAHFIDQVVQVDWSVLAVEARAAGDGLMLLYRDSRTPGRCMALANYYASLYSPMNGSSTDRAQAMVQMVAQLTDLRPQIATVNFAPLDGDAADTAALASAFADRAWYVRRISVSETGTCRARD